eukprot:99049-Pleurochrysis_carterae.AAC.2
MRDAGVKAGAGSGRAAKYGKAFAFSGFRAKVLTRGGGGFAARLWRACSAAAAAARGPSGSRGSTRRGAARRARRFKGRGGGWGWPVGVGIGN